MVKAERATTEGLAWLASELVQKSLRVEARGSAPQPGRLSFFAPDFALSAPEPWLLGEEGEPQSWAQKPMPQLVHKAEPSPADFARLHEEILERIAVGEFDKVVPMVCEEYEFAAPLQREMFQVTERAHQISYGFEYADEGMIGQTPEILFAVKDGVLHTMALAGTGRVDGPSLLNDRKERHEHNLVIEHLLAEMKDFGAIDVGTTEERPYGILKHLYTPLRVTLEREPEFMDLVVRLHPTAALGGWPRQPAVEWLQRQKFHAARGRFGAPFGYRDSESMLCVVAIRSVQWRGKFAQVSTGCGVVIESQAMKEWDELRLKRESIFRNLGMEL